MRPTLHSCIHAIIAGVLFLALPGAGGAVDDWKSRPPLKDKYDWVQLTSDELIKGEVIAMFDDRLEFDSEELGLLSLDWDDVKYMQSARMMQVWFWGNISSTGRLFVEGDSVRLLSNQEQQFQRFQILRITSGEPKEIDYWSGKVSIGADFRRGNSDQLEGNAKLNVMRRTVKNRVAIDYLGHYDETEKEESANNHRAIVVWDHFVSDRFFAVPVFVEYFRDPFQNIEHRGMLGCGLGYQMMDSAKSDWRILGGPAYQKTQFVEVKEGRDAADRTPAVLVGTTFDTELSQAVDFKSEYRFQVVSKESGRYQHHMIFGFEIDLGELPDLAISLIWDHINNPQEEADGHIPFKDDLRLTLGLGWRF